MHYGSQTCEHFPRGVDSRLNPVEDDDCLFRSDARTSTSLTNTRSSKFFDADVEPDHWYVPPNALSRKGSAPAVIQTLRPASLACDDSIDYRRKSKCICKGNTANETSTIDRRPLGDEYEDTDVSSFANRNLSASQQTSHSAKSGTGECTSQEGEQGCDELTNFGSTLAVTRCRRSDVSRVLSRDERARRSASCYDDQQYLPHQATLRQASLVGTDTLAVGKNKLHHRAKTVANFRSGKDDIKAKMAEAPPPLEQSTPSSDKDVWQRVKAKLSRYVFSPNIHCTDGKMAFLLNHEWASNNNLSKLQPAAPAAPSRKPRRQYRKGRSMEVYREKPREDAPRRSSYDFKASDEMNPSDAGLATDLVISAEFDPETLGRALQDMLLNVPAEHE